MRYKKMKIKNIVDAIQSLQKIASSDVSLQTLYSVNKLMKKVEEEIEFFEKERINILEKYGKRIDNDKYKIEDNLKTEYEKAMTELLNIEVKNNIDEIILPMTENIQLSYNDLKALNGFVKVEFED